MSPSDILSRHIARVVHADPAVVYAYASDPSNLPLWASGLASSAVRREGDRLLVESPMGEVVVTFAPQNDFGVLDHDVTVPSGALTHNPFRVIPHPDGAEVVFAVRQDGLTDEEFERDAATIAGDLDRLSEQVEARERTTNPAIRPAHGDDDGDVGDALAGCRRAWNHRARGGVPGGRDHTTEQEQS